MLAPNHERPFDDHYYNGCPQLLQLILFFYEISKTIVFWTNVLLILSDTITRANFSWLRFTTNKFIETAARLIYWVLRPFRTKPLESFVTENQIVDLIDKILWKQKHKALKIENEQYQPIWILTISLGSLIQDILADTLDFILGTRSRYQQRDCGHRGEAAGSMPFKKSKTKDRSSLRRLNTAVLDEEASKSSPQLICQNCGHPVVCNSCIVITAA